MSFGINKIFKIIKTIMVMEDVSFLDDKLPNEVIKVINDFLKKNNHYYNLWYDYYMYPFY